MKSPGAFAQLPFQADFDRFQSTLDLDPEARARASRAWEAIRSQLLKSDDHALLSVFCQGSFANGTLVRPNAFAAGFDLDIVALAQDAPAAPTAALEWLESWLPGPLAPDATVERRERCATLDFGTGAGGRFRIDIVLARPSRFGTLEIAVRDQGWHETDPRAYTRWCLGQPPQFQRAVRLLKWWRQRTPGMCDAVKPIFLEALVARTLPRYEASDAKVVAACLSGITDLVSRQARWSAPLPNPVLQREDLARRWPPAEYRAFVAGLRVARRLAEAALRAGPTRYGLASWRELLGPEFGTA